MTLYHVQRILGPVFNPAAPLHYDSVLLQIRDLEGVTPDANEYYNYPETDIAPDTTAVLCDMQEMRGYTPNDFGVTCS